MVNIEGILLIYMFLCMSMIGFNVVIAVYNRYEDKLYEGKNKRLEELLEKQIQLIESGLPIDPKIQKYLTHKLKRTKNLMSVHKKIQQLMREEHSVIAKYLEQSKDVFSVLAKHYGKKDEMSRTYFAHVLSLYGIETEAIRAFLMECCLSSSVFCRENALQAFYRLGRTQDVVIAYERLHRYERVHGHRLLSEGLLKFKGNQEALAKELWNKFDEWNLDMQIAIINAIKVMGLDYRSEFYNLLVDVKRDKEIRLAAMRYLGKHVYDPAKSYMITQLQDAEQVDFEYRVNAARELQNYSGEVVRETLKQALKDRNWYVRFNAAESLWSMDCEESWIRQIDFNDNPYGKEILYYMEQKKVLKEEKRDGSYSNVS